MKEQEPLLELDRDEKKFDIFLTFHRSSLVVSDLKIFLPFTINLDPYIKKVIKGNVYYITYSIYYQNYTNVWYNYYFLFAEEHQNQVEETMVYGNKTPMNQVGPQWAPSQEWTSRSNIPQQRQVRSIPKQQKDL